MLPRDDADIDIIMPAADAAAIDIYYATLLITSFTYHTLLRLRRLRRC